MEGLVAVGYTMADMEYVCMKLMTEEVYRTAECLNYYNCKIFIAAEGMNLSISVAAILISLVHLADTNIIEKCKLSKEPMLDVDCSYANLQNIPRGIPIGAKSLNFSWNYIKLDKDLKHSVEAECVEIIDLSHNHISYVPAFWFWGFKHLKFLDLSFNLLIEINFFLPPSLNKLNISMNILKSIQTDITTDDSMKIKKYDVNQIEYSEEIVYNNDNATCIYLPYLTILDISNNSIQELNHTILKCMKNLKQLYLKSNEIHHLKSGTFTENRYLEFLDISWNNISDIESGVFKHLEFLEYLSLSGNRLTSVPSYFPSIKWLDISNNKITRVSESSKNDLFPQEVLLIGKNPFHCDCNLHWLKEYYDTREYQVKFLKNYEEKFIPVCASPPSLANESWNFLSSDLFICESYGNRIVDNDVSVKSGIFSTRSTQLYVTRIGQDYVKLMWSSDNVNEIQPVLKYGVSFHQFGQKRMRKSIIFHSTLTRYTLGHLQGGTAYIICLKEIDEKTDLLIQDFDCVEIVTERKPSELYKTLYTSMMAIITIVCLIMVRKLTSIHLIFH